MTSINGIGLAPDGKNGLRDLSRRTLDRSLSITGEGTVDRGPGYKPGRPIATFTPGTIIDSLKVEADETICVAVPVGERAFTASNPTAKALASSDIRRHYQPCLRRQGPAHGLHDRLSVRASTQSQMAAPGLKLNYQSV